MNSIGSIILCIVILIICSTGLIRKVPIFDTFLSGGKDGLRAAFNILPSLIGLTTAVSMLMASGALDMMISLFSPAVKIIGIPPETLPLALMRPISGSGALAVYKSVIDAHGPDSHIGLVASTMMGSTETTFYTIAVYFGSLKITKLRHTVPSALAADLAGFIASALAVRLIFGLAIN